MHISYTHYTTYCVFVNTCSPENLFVFLPLTRSTCQPCVLHFFDSLFYPSPLQALVYIYRGVQKSGKLEWTIPVKLVQFLGKFLFPLFKNQERVTANLFKNYTVKKPACLSLCRLLIIPDTNYAPVQDNRCARLLRGLVCHVTFFYNLHFLAHGLAGYSKGGGGFVFCPSGFPFGKHFPIGISILFKRCHLSLCGFSFSIRMSLYGKKRHLVLSRCVRTQILLKTTATFYNIKLHVLNRIPA